MSKWRYEVIEKTGDLFGEYRPEYVVYSLGAINEYMKRLYGEDYKEHVRYWEKYASEMPTRAIYDEKLYWCIQGFTYGTKECICMRNLTEVYPAKRLGRMFPRHKQQIVYK